MVPGERLVTLAAVTLAPTEPISWKLAVPVFASTRNELSLFELSLQVRWISVSELPLATRPDGAAGTWDGGAPEHWRWSE